VSLQTRLLRVLQAREVLRVGATEPTPVNVRVIAATHRALRDQVDKGQFRLDLYFRLNILRLDVPPLRARLQDIVPIAQALQGKICQRLGMDQRTTSGLLDALIDLAQGYDWPGNVRELENLIERVMAYGGAQVAWQAMSPAQWRELVASVAPELAERGVRALPSMSPVPPNSLRLEGMGASPATLSAQRKQMQAQAERVEIMKVLADCDGDRALASEKLGISRTTLWRKLKDIT
ncbi:MAG: propionate catabolism operon regulatory protein PrpR, partial [Aquabacterium sp.]|uniref:sigma 54-interacting transcriptional regulator n=1 Tax=Aquabacterium sp. TaxID=1872578 RepID=UPI00122243DC